MPRQLIQIYHITWADIKQDTLYCQPEDTPWIKHQKFVNGVCREMLKKGFGIEKIENMDRPILSEIKPTTVHYSNPYHPNLGEFVRDLEPNKK